ncbi:YtxH domain-containing protein [Gordonia insulae]|uniref:YtxH domain-containing protein n=1 Tax=Gordonia insulae TaxID=2420509 RepID=A0A3G8JKQ5_9ACTN|nr:YtxH domain-containing protein [Gordonia insulae]AZG45667.1 hypothetical protein D7316_02267 [Gordonia insulae]
MGPATHDRSPDVLTRVAAAVVVPVVAVAAHGLGSGSMPGPSGLLLSAGIGALVAAVLGGGRRRTTTTDTVFVTGLLTSAQIGSHLAFTVGQPPMAMHHDAVLPMLLTHLVAVPLGAVLIVVASSLLAILTSTIWRLVPPPPIAPAPVVLPIRWADPWVPAGPVVGGTGVRGPPVLS